VKQYEIWWATLPPPVGRRPVLLLTRNPAYAYLNKVLVAEVTTTIRGIPQEVTVGRPEGLPSASVVNLDNLHGCQETAHQTRGVTEACARGRDQALLGHALAWMELTRSDATRPRRWRCSDAVKAGLTKLDADRRRLQGRPVGWPRWNVVRLSPAAMPVEGKTIPDLLQQSREVCGDVVVHRYANGLTIKTEVFTKPDRLRILPLGTPQASLMNHMLNFPHRVRGRRVFEPFAGSGALGFMALKAGAARVDFLDINPRAAEFQRENAALNQVGAGQFTSITGDIAHFAPARTYDLIIANPPFVPTPQGIDGTITSNGGPEGNHFVDILLRRLEEFLEPSGRALIYVFQFALRTANR
jgi:mRNA-degrading endonuclease toxin of MazEF toxin-antitoxin module